jgi:hypothetical protein
MSKKKTEHKVDMGHVILLRPGKGAHHNLADDVRRGRSRKNKHKGKRDW